MIDTNIFADEVDNLGESVTLSVITKSISDWGDATGSTSDAIITAVHNDIQGDEEFNMDGRFHPGDKVFFVKPSVSLSVGNQVVFNSNNYEVKEIITHHIQGSDFVKEVRCGRV